MDIGSDVQLTGDSGFEVESPPSAALKGRLADESVVEEPVEPSRKRQFRDPQQRISGQRTDESPRVYLTMGLVGDLVGIWVQHP